MAVASPILISIALQYHVISLSYHTNSQHRASAVINIILQQARSFGFGLLRCCRLLHQLGCTSLQGVLKGFFVVFLSGVLVVQMQTVDDELMDSWRADLSRD